MKFLWIIPLLVGISILIPSINAEIMKESLEGGMEIEITYPEEIVVGRDGSISILVKNNGWEDKQNISFIFSSQDNALIINSSDTIIIEELTEGGSYGINIDFSIPENTISGMHFLNLKYSHILVANNETPQPALFHDIAIPISIKKDANVLVYSKLPESIFANAEFPVEIKVISEDVDISNVSIEIIPPKDIEFRGETFHFFSKIEKNGSVEINSRMVSPVNEVNKEYKIPFEIVVNYLDDIGKENTDSQIIPIVLRPRTFMELTTDGGIWVGDFFIAPYVSLGTIIGIPAGAIISLLIRKNQKIKKGRKRKN